MSFLAGRLAAAEGAFFVQESKLAASRLAQKLPPPPPSTSAAAKNDASSTSSVAAADVLPEILRHSLPIKGASSLSEAAATPSLSTSSKWLVSSSSASSAATISPDALNPLRAYVSMPQATFGPKRWQFSDEYSGFSASTANEMRHDRQPSVDPEKLKAVLAGYARLGKAFAFATLIVFGGATTLFLYTAHKLQFHSIDDIRIKGKDLIQPGADSLKEQMVPLRTWAENMSRKWHIEGGKVGDRTITKELSKQLSWKRV